MATPERLATLAAVTYTTVLFDLDHTLLDSEASELAAYMDTLAAFGVADPLALFETYRTINQALWRHVEAGELGPNDVRVRRFEEFNVVVGIDADPSSMAERFVVELGANGDLYPGVWEMLTAVHQRATLALVTNGISEVQRARVARLRLDRFFDVVVVSSEVGVAKPAPEIFDIVFERLGSADVERAVMVGDSLSSDMAGAAGYGVATCWFNPEGLTPPTDLALDHVVTSIADVPSALSRSNIAGRRD